MKETFSILACSLLFSLVSFAQDWTQFGQEISGSLTNQATGFDVSMSNDGSRIAVASQSSTGGAAYDGEVRIYDYTMNGQWTQVGTPFVGASANTQLGYSVSLSGDGNRVAIGSIYTNSYAGSVDIYDFDGNNWIQVGSSIVGEAPNNQSGWSVSLSDDGNSVAIGAPYNSFTMNAADQGHARVFTFNGTDWTQVGSDIDGVDGGDHAGFSVSLNADGTIMAIGEPEHDYDWNLVLNGRARIFQFNGVDWIQMGSDIGGEYAGDRLGYTLALSADGNTIVCGAAGNNGNGTGPSTGHVRIFHYNGVNWSQVGSDIDGDSTYNQFGRKVAISDDGSTVVAGAPYHDGNGQNSGQVKVYEFSGTDWAQKGTDLIGETTIATQGYALAIDSTGSKIVVSALNNLSSSSNAGHVKTYKFCSNSSSTQTISACNSYTWIDGITYSSSTNSVTFTLPNSAGCDSVISLNLTITSLTPTVSFTAATATLTANQAGVDYQWIDCSTMSPINGETAQSYSPLMNGQYAVVISQNGCSDTSNCMTVAEVGMNETMLGNQVTIFPNPTEGEYTINLGNLVNPAVNIYSIQGVLIDKIGDIKQEEINLHVKGDAGIYWIEILSDGVKRQTLQLMKQ